jgi:cysteine desulfurase
MEAYFDANATCPIPPESWLELCTLAESFGTLGNPSSQHKWGRNANVALESFRKVIAKPFDLEPNQVILTSGATESNQLALTGVLNQFQWTQGDADSAQISLHVVCGATEHPSALSPLEKWTQGGPHRVLTQVPPQADGTIHVECVFKSLRHETVLLSLMAANNETGHVYPVLLIATLLHILRWGSDSQKLKLLEEHPFLEIPLTWPSTYWQKLHFHVDATQSIGKIPLHHWWGQGVDSASFSGHKWGSLPGVGVLLLRRGRKFLPLFWGGAQERNRRPGTQNLWGALSLKLGWESLFKDELSYIQKWDPIRNYLKNMEDELHTLNQVRVVSQVGTGLPNTLMFTCLKPLQSQDVLMELDMAGVYASSGSACSSGTSQPSHVLQALGLSPSEWSQGVRISATHHTTLKELDYLKTQLFRVLQRSH